MFSTNLLILTNKQTNSIYIRGIFLLFYHLLKPRNEQFKISFTTQTKLATEVSAIRESRS
ncbi:hypothetical protein VIBC2010_11301 [Vibrio caribbeanicus ATCC BAA-2122]|uniref:Uncharacterized protein n=1 Tax=Vibrio caribbeanicus ATCC BAA-2122 TaxID=796620 RepID=E3BF28_9VIBR|nr:hypothetical protein VIBC2010_11301 [Vibrio caribbeanicus ATCC BAA-2122]